MRWFLVIGLNFSILLSVTLVGCNGYQERASQHYQKGRQLFHEEDFTEAKREFSIVAFSFAHSPVADSAQEYVKWCEAGEIALKAREFFFISNLPEASHLATLARESGKDLPLVQFVNGLVAFKSGQIGEAQVFFEQIKANPQSGDYILLALAEANFIDGRCYKAQEQFIRAFEQSQVRSIKEVALNALVQVRLAIPVEGARNLVSCFPPDNVDLPLVYYVTGKLYSQGYGKNYELAEQYLSKAIELAPETRIGTDAEIALAKLFIEKPGEAQNKVHSLKQALLLAKNALQYYPDDPDYQFTFKETERVLQLITK